MNQISQTASHNTLTEIGFNLPGKVLRSPMPFGPYDRLNQVWDDYQQSKVDAVFILVEKQEYLVHAQRDLIQTYRSAGLDIIHHPIQDFSVPDEGDAIEEAVSSALKKASDGKNIAIHCLAGIGRTGIFLACMAKRHFRFNGLEAIQWVRKFIPKALENPTQEQFVINF